jgi:hypothetical protein
MVLSSELVSLISGDLTTVGRVHKCRFEAEAIMARLRQDMQLANAPPAAQQSCERYRKLFDDATALFAEANRLDQVHTH